MPQGANGSLSRSLLGMFAAAGLVALAPTVTSAQCPGAWVGGFETTGPDGRVWSIMPTPVQSPWAGDLIVAGYFQHAGGGTRRGIARYAPASNTWGSVDTGAGLNEGIGDFVYKTLMLPGGDLLAGGQTTSAGGISARGIARLHVSTGTWSLVGGGLDGPSPIVVGAMLQLADGDVLVGGRFVSAGGQTVNHIARYRPTTDAWIGVQGGVAGPAGNPSTSVGSLVQLPNGEVFVAGGFNSAGGIPAPGYARYAPATDSWSAVAAAPFAPAGLPTLLLDGTVLVATYEFAPPATITTHLLRYIPTSDTWVDTGVTANSDVFTLVTLPHGEVMVGGRFTTIGGTAARAAARYNPTTNACLALGTGLDSEVYAFAAIPDGSLSDVFIGGMFSRAGEALSPHIARYSLGRICPADFDCSGSLGVPDIFSFLNAWFALDISADFNGVFGISTQDIFDFLGAWFAGC